MAKKAMKKTAPKVSAKPEKKCGKCRK